MGPKTVKTGQNLRMGGKSMAKSKIGYKSINEYDEYELY